MASSDDVVPDEDFNEEPLTFIPVCHLKHVFDTRASKIQLNQPCPEKDCEFVGRTEADLAEHMALGLHKYSDEVGKTTSDRIKLAWIAGLKGVTSARKKGF